jgi:basic amino acid/polyamine antiporter, APA family
MEKNTGKFKQSLTLFDSTALVAGSMIGSGIFIVSAEIARNVGAPGWLLAVWAITGIMTIFAAIGYGELASLLPRAGGTYVYLREAYSPLFGFLYGWTLFLVIQSGTIAAVAMAFSKYLGVLFPWISEDYIFLRYNSFQINYIQVIAILSVFLLTWINSKGIDQGKKVQNMFTFSKVIILLLIIVIGFIFAGPYQETGWWNASKVVSGIHTSITGWALIVAVGVSMVGSLFSSDAWYNITFTSSEVIRPKRNIPLSLLLGTLLVSVLYFAVNLVYVKILPVYGSPYGINVADQGMQFASEDRVATAVMYQILSHPAEYIMAIVLVISTFGCNNGLILSGARVYYAMATDGLFFRRVSKLNEKGVPSVGLWLQAAWCTILCLSGSYSQLLDYVIFAALIFNILTIAAVFVFRIKRPNETREYKALGYPFIPALYIILCLFIEYILLIYKSQYTWPGLVLVMLGIPVFFTWKYKSRIYEILFKKKH